MTIKWHLLKYLPDVRRGEPINVGIVMEHDGGFDFRLRDVEDGKVLSSAKSWCREPANYGQWIKYLRYHLAEYGNVDIEPRAGESYRMLPSGQVSSEGIDPAGFMVELYNMLIAPPARSSRRNSDDGFEEQVERLLTQAGLASSEHFRRRFPVLNTHGQSRPFHYAWENGHTTVGSRLGSMNGSSVDAALWRFNALPPEIGSVLILGDVDTKDVASRAQLDSIVTSVVQIDDLNPNDLYGLFAELPRRREPAA
jgi:hypothetical protein